MEASRFEYAVAAFFALWFGLTVYCQPGKGRHRLARRYDVLNLIPTWTFFAPNPATANFHLVYRDRMTDGTFTEWTEVFTGESRRLLHFVWNPRKVSEKALVDLVGTLATEAALLVNRFGEATLNPRVLQVSSIAYLILLNHISSRQRLPGSESTQFALLRLAAGQQGDQRIIFISSVHQLSRH